MPHAKNVIKIDCVYGFHLNCRFTFSMKLPRHFVPRKDSISGLSIVRWDISLALNMTYFFTRHSERSEESHDTSEEYMRRT